MSSESSLAEWRNQSYSDHSDEEFLVNKNWLNDCQLSSYSYIMHIYRVVWAVVGLVSHTIAQVDQPTAERRVGQNGNGTWVFFSFSDVCFSRVSPLRTSPFWRGHNSWFQIRPLLEMSPISLCIHQNKCQNWKCHITRLFFYLNLRNKTELVARLSRG